MRAAPATPTPLPVIIKINCLRTPRLECCQKGFSGSYTAVLYFISTFRWPSKNYKNLDINNLSVIRFFQYTMLAYHCESAHKNRTFNPLASRTDAETHCISSISVDSKLAKFEYREVDPLQRSLRSPMSIELRLATEIFPNPGNWLADTVGWRIILRCLARQLWERVFERCLFWWTARHRLFLWAGCCDSILYPRQRNRRLKRPLLECIHGDRYFRRSSWLEHSRFLAGGYQKTR